MKHFRMKARKMNNSGAYDLFVNGKLTLEGVPYRKAYMYCIDNMADNDDYQEEAWCSSNEKVISGKRLRKLYSYIQHPLAERT